MEIPSRSNRWSDRGSSALWLAALALALFAYRTLLLGALELPSLGVLEGWLFRPSKLPVLLVLGASLWLAFRRLARLRSLPARTSLSALLAWSSIAVGFFVWAQLTRAGELLLPALAATVLAIAGAARGWRGCRALALPAAALLLGLQIPNPLRAEGVWALQQISATGAAELLTLFGVEVTRSGVLLLRPEATFHVIDACSGLQAVQLLLLIAILIRELFPDRGARSWVVVALAPAMAAALNVVRIALIALGSDPEALAGPERDHTLQGVAVLATGTALLYAVAWWLAPAGPAAESSGGALQPGAAGGTTTALPVWSAIALTGVLALASLLVSPFALPARALNAAAVEFVVEEQGWASRALEVNTSFTGPLPQGQRLYLRFEDARARRSEGAVELFVAFEVGRFLTSGRLLSSKLLQPGPEWEIEETRSVRLWALGRDGEFTIARRPNSEERAVVYTWRLRDAGPWVEFWRSLFALESTPWRRSARRGVVQIVAFAAHDGPLMVDRAKQQLDRFLTSYRKQLGAL